MPVDIIPVNSIGHIQDAIPDKVGDSNININGISNNPAIKNSPHVNSIESHLGE